METENDTNDFKTLIKLLAACIVGYFIVYFLTFFSPKSNELGDTAGIANGLFSALAFAGVIYTIFLQKKELGLQREELKCTRAELAGQKEEMKMQNNTLKKQRFENTFFSMLSLQQELLNNIRLKGRAQDVCVELVGHAAEENVDISGRDVFDFIYKKRIQKEITKSGITGYAKYEKITMFDHYYRHLYRIIKFISLSNLADSEQYEYTSIVRAQLSDCELLMLFYSCLNKTGTEKFKPLTERYALFKNIRSELLVDKKHKMEYDNGAYKYQKRFYFRLLN